MSTSYRSRLMDILIKVGLFSWPVFNQSSMLCNVEIPFEGGEECLTRDFSERSLIDPEGLKRDR